MADDKFSIRHPKKGVSYASARKLKPYDALDQKASDRAPPVRMLYRPAWAHLAAGDLVPLGGAWVAVAPPVRAGVSHGAAYQVFTGWARNVYLLASVRLSVQHGQVAYIGTSAALLREAAIAVGLDFDGLFPDGLPALELKQLRIDARALKEPKGILLE